MRYVNWKKNYEIGVGEIDLQHKKIFSIANEFFTELFSDTYINGSNNILTVLKELRNYCKFHFDYEKNIYSEEIIQEYFVNEYKLLEKIDKLICSNKQDINIVKLYAFAEHLRQWIVKHVLLLNDKKYRETLKNKVFVVQ